MTGNVTPLRPKVKENWPSLGEIMTRLGGKMLPDGQLRTFCPAHGDNKTPNLDIKDAEDKHGKFTRLVICRTGCTGNDVISALQDQKLWPGGDLDQIPPPIYKKPKSYASKKAQYKEYIDKFIADATTDLDLVKMYLWHRGIRTNDLGEARYHPRIWHAEIEEKHPCFISPIRGVWDEIIEPGSFYKQELLDIVGVQRIWLTQNGCKIDHDYAKKAVGQVKGGGVFLAPPGQIGKMVCISEGIETGYALQRFFDLQTQGRSSRIVVIAAVMASNLQFVPIPFGVERILIAGDLDRSNAGQKAVSEARTYYKSFGIDTKGLFPLGTIPDGKKSVDWLDVLREA